MPYPRTPAYLRTIQDEFKKLARFTWKSLAARRELDMRWPEVAITNELVFRLAKANLPYVQVFEALQERYFGHDLDLFVEVRPDRYLLLCLQAKVMYPNTVYQAINHHVPDPVTQQLVPQWQLLQRHPADRLSFYLFYNGFSPATYARRIGSRTPPEVLGCSVLPLRSFARCFLTASGTLSVAPASLTYKALNEPPAGLRAVPWHWLFKAGWLTQAVKTCQLHAGSVLLGDTRYRQLAVPPPGSADDPDWLLPTGDAPLPDVPGPAAYRVIVSSFAADPDQSPT